ncbi:MAG TPA: FtsQ-type POTRA domain-containing protein [Rhizomicrobium sp.]|nr:FtsQ-type POTRA domain-containing protein [Rhizomicrobium sp.]
MRQVKSNRRTKASARRGWMSTVMLRADARGGQSKRRGREERGISRVASAVTGSITHRPMLSVTLAFILCAALAGYISGGHFGNAYQSLGRGTANAIGKLGFAVHHVTISGNERTSTDAINAALGIQSGQSIFSVDPAGVRSRLLQLPWVSGAEVRRRFPDTVSVAIVEKHPFALWKNGNEMAVVERSGAVITKADIDEFSHLPLILGPGAPQAAAPLLDAISASRAVAARVRAAERISERRWNLILDGNVVVKLPEDGWANQLAELERLIVDKGVLERDIESIDLRYPDSYIFRLHNGDSQPVPRERGA